MCGIFCVFGPCTCENIKDKLENIFEKCEVNIRKRGPDYQTSVRIRVKEYEFLLSSSVLWLQGSILTKQPIETERFWFLYNGDVFGDEILSSSLRRSKGDTGPLLDALEQSECLINCLNKIKGPYSFILIDKINDKLYFARDTFGRRSLLIGLNNKQLLLTSVSSRTCFDLIELPPLGIYSIDLNIDLKSIDLVPWESENQHFDSKLLELESFLTIPIKCEANRTRIKVPLFKTPPENDLKFFEQLLNNSTFDYVNSDVKWRSNIIKLHELLQNSVKKRIENQPELCKTCFKSNIPNCAHATIGILFSGGVDCAIISLIADQFIDSSRSIDLLNIAFEKGDINFQTPDRLTALQTLTELKALRPERHWNLLEINVTQAELIRERENTIADLIFPLKSILDESLGCALWFAARGRTDAYISPCRVLLVGMGADELFGGYTRHRSAFKRGDWNELANELLNDWKTISYRNLARDDRVISDHGRQVRTPYLDEDVVEFVQQLNAWERCYPSDKVAHGFGDKLLLRALANHQGLKQAAILRKRALQFGSRIANRKENAHERSPRL